MHAATVALLFSLMACHHDVDGTDGAFYDWDDRKVHCAVDLDSFARVDQSSVEAGLDRAVERGEVLELYAHDPGRTVEWAALDNVLSAIDARGLPYLTYADLARGHVAPSAGVLVSFDDASLDDWVAGIDLFAAHSARLTFFVAYVDRMGAGDLAKLHTLASAGHAIEAHSIKHLRAPLYVEQKGVDAYLADEALPSIDLLRGAGFDISTYAYPYGARTDELDEALLRHVDLLRSVAFTWTGPADPCPE